MGVILRGLGTPRSAGENFGCTWEHLDAPTTSLGAPRITVEHSGKNNLFFGNAAGAPGNHSYYHHSTIIKTHVFSLYSHLCIYIATHLHTVYQEWLQAVLNSNSRCAWNQRLSELRDTLRPWWSKFVDALRGGNWAYLEIHFEAMIEGT